VLENLLDILDIDLKSALPGIHTQHTKSWTSFCLRNHKRDPSQTFSLLHNNQDVLSIQIAMCNLLAVNKRIPLCARSPDKPDRPILGTCSRKVQVGDQIVRLEGVPQLLIVRADHEAGRSVQIINPAVLFTILKEKPSNIFTRGSWKSGMSSTGYARYI
jgi:hypothetical protein